MQRLLRRGADQLRTPRLLGAVLAGGTSRRFGEDKAVVELDGRSLVRRAVDTLAAVFDEVVVIGRSPNPGSERGMVADRRPGHGPSGGIETALFEARARGFEGVFILACDLPLVDEALVRSLVGALGDAPAVAAMPAAGAASMQPLCAVYRVACAPAVTAALDRGERRVRDLFALLGGRCIEHGRSGTRTDPLLNVNTRSDWEVAHAALLRRGD